MITLPYTPEKLAALLSSLEQLQQELKDKAEEETLEETWGGPPAYKDYSCAENHELGVTDGETTLARYLLKKYFPQCVLHS